MAGEAWLLGALAGACTAWLGPSQKQEAGLLPRVPLIPLLCLRPPPRQVELAPRGHYTPVTADNCLAYIHHVGQISKSGLSFSRL